MFIRKVSILSFFFQKNIPLLLMKTLGFNKEERLKSRKLIESLFFESKSITHYPFRSIYKILPESADFKYPAKVAISVSKKKFSRAVDRNEIKRKIREAYRKNKDGLYKNINCRNRNAYFLIVYVASEKPDSLKIENDIKLLISKFIEHLNSQEC